MQVTTPTELNNLLKKDRLARRIYKSLSDSAKRSYAAYIIAAASSKDRLCRANHAVKMLTGEAALMNARC